MAIEPGNKFNRWTVVKRLDNRKGRACWECRCDCGTVRGVYADNLRNENSKSCGCHNLQALKARHQVPVGQKFGRWTVMTRVGDRLPVMWKCRCDCGTVKEVSADNLRRSHTISCGCYNLEQLIKGGRWGSYGKNHVWKTPEYRLWRKARDRATEWAERSGKPLENLFNITPQDISIPEVCPVLHIPLRSGHRVGDASPSLDRIDSTKGYLKTNTEVISHRANTLKNNATIEELEMVIAHLRKTSSREGT